MHAPYPAQAPKADESSRRRRAASPPPALEIIGLRAGFSPTGDPPVLSSVNLRLAAGEILGLVGASGSGKSLLAGCISRLETPARITAGRMLLDGTDLCRESPHTAARQRGRGVVLIPQDPRGAMDPLFSVGFQIDESLAPGHSGHPPGKRKQTKTRRDLLARARSLLRRTGIAASKRRLRQYPHQWSRGMLQRALLAAAFAVRPRVLVLDEVTSALDPTIALQILTLIRELSKDHETGVLFITHELDQARYLCDRMAVLQEGRIVECTSTQAVFANPSHAGTRRQVGAW